MVALAGCAETTTPQGQVSDVPEGVLAIAAPFQDLSNLRIDPDRSSLVEENTRVFAYRDCT